MRLLFLSDTQLGAGRSLADGRLADQEAVLTQIADLAHDRDCDYVIHCGDVFEHRHPGEEERLVFKRWLAKVTAWQKVNEPRAHFADPGRKARVIVVAGNHDLSNTALASAVDLYDRCEFIRIPTVIDLGGCSLACLPWAPIHNLAANRESSERAGANAEAAAALAVIAADLRRQCPPGKPAILAAHWAISGASLPSGIPVEDLAEVVIPQEALSGFDLVCAGHIHRAGFFAPTMLYAGSPYPCSFGEAEQPHGAWIVDTDAGALHAVDATIERIPSRRLVTIDCDLTQDSSAKGAASHAQEEGPRSPTPETARPTTEAPGMRAPTPESNRERSGGEADTARAIGPPTSPTSPPLAEPTEWLDDPFPTLQGIEVSATGEISGLSAKWNPDETDHIAAAVAEQFPLTDATVRLRYRASEEQHRRIDIPAIRRLLADAGAHRLAQIEPTIVRQGRARAAVVDETLEPAAALDAWCEANSVEGAQRGGLHGLLARFGE